MKNLSNHFRTRKGGRINFSQHPTDYHQPPVYNQMIRGLATTFMVSFSHTYEPAQTSFLVEHETPNILNHNGKGLLLIASIPGTVWVRVFFLKSCGQHRFWDQSKATFFGGGFVETKNWLMFQGLPQPVFCSWVDQHHANCSPLFCSSKLVSYGLYRDNLCWKASPAGWLKRVQCWWISPGKTWDCRVWGLHQESWSWNTRSLLN